MPKFRNWSRDLSHVHFSGKFVDRNAKTEDSQFAYVTFVMHSASNISNYMYIMHPFKDMEGF